MKDYTYTIETARGAAHVTVQAPSKQDADNKVFYIIKNSAPIRDENGVIVV